MSNSSKDIKSLFRKQLGSKFPQTKPSKSSNAEISHNSNLRKRKFKKDVSIEEVKTKSILKNKLDAPVETSDKASSGNKVKFVNNAEISRKFVENEDNKAVDENAPEIRANDVMSIPDGFFDDPHLELKTKKVLPKTKMDEDYELFLKSIETVSKENEEKMEQESQNDAVKLQLVENINETIIWSSFNNLINSIEAKRTCLTTGKGNLDSNSPSDSSSDESNDGEILWRNKSNCKFH